MIPFFPDPYPDELLYSVCARYQDQVQYPTTWSVVKDLFGIERAVAVVDLPSRLGNLVAALPLGHCYTVEQFIDDHTLLPFYSPFCLPEQIKLVREDMQGTNGSKIHGRLGLLINRRQEWLQFCPLCAASDEKQFGEPYWHRLHQVPGVMVCPVHAVFLEKSQVNLRHQVKRYQFISAKQAIQITSPRFLNFSAPCHKGLLNIARDVAWLLCQRNLVPGFNFLGERYRRLLTECGLAAYSGRVRNMHQLIDAFKNFHPPDLLQWLQCELDEKIGENWLVRLLRVASKNKSQNPLYHLLLIHFLGYTTEEFFKQKSAFAPFGRGPWPCLNPASDHFKQLLINEYHLSYSYEHGRLRNQPVGVFSCTCGFVYSRIGSDLLSEDRFRISRVKAFGLIWETALRNLWSDPTISFKEILRRLGFSEPTVMMQAVRLGLSFPRLGPNGRKTQLTKLLNSRNDKTKATELNKLESYRMALLSAMAENPGAGRSLLRVKFKRIYSWLYTYDYEWLNVLIPSRRSQKESNPQQPPRVDWKKRDAQLADLARLTALRLKNTPGRPVQITKQAISRDIGQVTLISKNLSKLPLTAKALAEVVETAEELAIRRVQWAHECFLKENIHPKRYQLISRASMGRKMADSPQVKKAIATALESLDPLNT